MSRGGIHGAIRRVAGVSEDSFGGGKVWVGVFAGEVGAESVDGHVPAQDVHSTGVVQPIICSGGECVAEADGKPCMEEGEWCELKG